MEDVLGQVEQVGLRHGLECPMVEPLFIPGEIPMRHVNSLLFVLDPLQPFFSLGVRMAIANVDDARRPVAVHRRAVGVVVRRQAGLVPQISATDHGRQERDRQANDLDHRRTPRQGGGPPGISGGLGIIDLGISGLAPAAGTNSAGAPR